MTDDVKVEVRRSGRRFDAEAVLDLAADPQTVWDTITDYDALSQLHAGHPRLPGDRTPDRRRTATEHLVVEQQGEFRFMLFAQAMTVLLNIEHRLLRVAEAKSRALRPGPVQAPRDRCLRGSLRIDAARRRAAARRGRSCAIPR